MKTQKIISAKLVTTSMLVVILLTIASCGSGQEKSARENEQSSVSETKVKPPSMDIHAAVFMGNLEAINQHIKAGE